MSCSSLNFRRELRIAVTHALLVVLLLPLLAFGRATETGSLYKAILEGKVAATFRGTGASSGAAVRVTVTKTALAGSAILNLAVPPGSMLNSGNSGAQNMVIMGVLGLDVGGGMIAPASRITVSSAPAGYVLVASSPTSSGAVTYVLSAFCAEFEKNNPSPSDTFTLGPPDPVLACVASQGRTLSLPAKQAAVWMYTDNMTFERINHKFAVSSTDWASAEAVFQRCQGFSGTPQIRQVPPRRSFGFHPTGYDPTNSGSGGKGW